MKSILPGSETIQTQANSISTTHSKYHVYPPVLPEIEEWPIYQLSQDRTSFVKDVESFIYDRLSQSDYVSLYNMIAKTIYNERIRIKEEPWKVDPPNDSSFWSKMQSEILKVKKEEESEASTAILQGILTQIINRYTEEIVGTFNKSTFLFARKFLTFFFNKLLNTAIWFRKLTAYKSKQFKIHNRLNVIGEIDSLRNLMDKGTVVVIPTHFSNIDSVFIGYAMDAVLGLPSFSFGAGLNLYNSGIAAYYMNRLGAYRVDRRKKNPIYLESLKSMATLSLKRGVNNIFFPGGTRSRSGAIEERLKMGLIGSVVEAQRALLQEGNPEKIFIFPVVLGYPFVLEAKFMIEQHLKKEGKEQYLKTKDQSYSFRRVTKFIWNFFSKSSDITLSIGKPLDVIGNFIDNEGNSLDKHGNLLSLSDYFKTNDNISYDLQRDSQYTRILSDQIVKRFKAENIVLSSHLVAFAGFQILKLENPGLDIYSLLRLPPEDFSFSTDKMHKVLEQLKAALIDLENKNMIKLSEEVRWGNEALLKHGITKMGSYHPRSPLMIDKNYQLIVSQDFQLLYYYHNKLSGYQLEKHVSL